MKQLPVLVCTCGKKPELEELPGNDFDDYAVQCECGIAWQIRDVTEELDELDPEANGFHNTPVECEGSECSECRLDGQTMEDLDCPYREERKGQL